MKDVLDQNMKLRRKTVISSESEDELANYCAVMEDKLFWLACL
jgi:hypothetical protein